MKHKYKGILTKMQRMSFFYFACSFAHVYIALYRLLRVYLSPFWHHYIQSVSIICSALTLRGSPPMC